MTLVNDLLVVEAEMQIMKQQLTETNKKLKKYKKEHNKLNSKYNKLNNKKKKLTLEIQTQTQLDNTKPSVSDHAIVRYMERIQNVDIEAIRTIILSPENISAIEVGAKKIKRDGITYVVNGSKMIATLYPTEENE